MNQKRRNWRIWLLLLTLALVLVRGAYIFTAPGIGGSYERSAGGALPASEPVPFQRLVQEFQTRRTHLDSLEFLFSILPEQHYGSLVLAVRSDQGLLYQTILPLHKMASGQWYRLKVNLPMEPGRLYRLELEPEKGVSGPGVFLVQGEEGAPEAGACYLDGAAQEGRLALRFGYEQPYATADKAARAALWAAALLLPAAALCRRQALGRARRLLNRTGAFFLRESAVPALFFGELLLCYLLVENSGIPFQPPTKAVLFFLSMAPFLNFRPLVRYLGGVMQTGGAKVGFILLDLYAAFALTGNRLFLYPLERRVAAGDVLVYCGAALWFAPVLGGALFWYGRFAARAVTHRRGSALRFGLLSAALLLIPAAFALYAFNPGISSYDSVRCLAESAHNIWELTDWHPPFYNLLLHAIIQVWDSTYAVILVQWLFWTYVQLELLFLLRRRGWGEGLLLLSALLGGCSASNFLYICTIWKDIPYALALLWLSVILAKLALEPRFYWKKRFIYLELTAALALTCLVRQNGVVPFVLTLAAGGALLRRSPKAAASMLLSVLIVFGVRGPLHRYLDVQPAYTGGIYLGLSQDILSVYYAGGRLSAEAMEMVGVLTYHTTSEYSHSPYHTNASYDLEIEMGRFIQIYLDTFFRNPVTLCKAVLCRMDVAWDIFDGADSRTGCVNYTGSSDTDENWARYYPARRENSFTHSVSQATAYTASNQLLRTLTWRAGLSLLATLAALFALTLKRPPRRAYLIFVPAAGQMLSLLLSTAWTDFRYYWPINLIAVLILLLLPTIQDRQGETDGL